MVIKNQIKEQSKICSNCNKVNTIELPIGVKLNYCMYCGKKLDNKNNEVD